MPCQISFSKLRYGVGAALIVLALRRLSIGVLAPNLPFRTETVSLMPKDWDFLSSQLNPTRYIPSSTDERVTP
jgi:hypothetical protein